MDDISREMGVSKKTLYQHFDNKADLVKKSVEFHIELEKAYCEQVWREIENAIDEMLAIGHFVVNQLRELNPSLVYDMQKYYRNCWDLVDTFHKEYIYSKLVENIELGKKQNMYRKNVDADIIAKLYISKMENIISSDLFPASKYASVEVYKEALKYHIYGIASEEGLKHFEKKLETL